MLGSPPEITSGTLGTIEQTSSWPHAFGAPDVDASRRLLSKERFDSSIRNQLVFV